jgi:hypothetical protein
MALLRPLPSNDKIGTNSPRGCGAAAASLDRAGIAGGELARVARGDRQQRRDDAEARCAHRDHRRVRLDGDPIVKLAVVRAAGQFATCVAVVKPRLVAVNVGVASDAM